ncbi:N-acetylmuramoyl-L-alanine amidase [Stenotrophomonas ginsengisoli]|uniref:N-acetylmuramoyl-L-alanine amidase n=1 Tax=Stenotrophomonas ginsengisoli TaxID=336566 RepID=UPI000B23CB28|nr:peptidoglycan recognition family protein [Stenotrophomonas ginsengisoli]
MSHRLTVLSAVLATVIAGPALAQSSIQLPLQPILIDDTVSNEEAQLQASLDLEERRLAPQRAAFVQHFRTAYHQYPSIPAGTLEALAYVQSRWMHMLPEHDSQEEAHNRMPAAWGVMGLYHGEGFADQVSEGARLLGVSSDKVRTDPLTNILAAAALLDAQIKRDHPQAGSARTIKSAALSPEAIRPALARYAGYSASALAGGEVDSFARNSFAYDVLLAQDRGVNDRGIVVPERAIAWENAYDANQLVAMRAPMVRLDVASDRIEIDGYAVDPVNETLTFNGNASPATNVGIASTDYGPAIWNPAHSTNYTASRSAAVSAVTVHTTQGSYAGSISWFQNSTSNVSAHYVIRSSDGQVTQMVRNAHTAWHVRNQNSYTLGIEHEGWVNNSSWYTDAMYSASAALVRNFCSKYSAIVCTSAYKGAASSGLNELAASVKIKGHQHFPGQSHTDPGINWNWSKYYNLINPGSGGGTTPPTGSTTYLDRFETSVGRFTTSPTYSGSTTGIATTSTTTRDCTTRKNGSCSLRVLLKDNTATTANWSVRLLSGAGTPANNASLTRSNGKVGFWVWTGGTGMSVRVGIDDSDGTERSTARSIPANSWTYVSWSLADAAQWSAWSGGNGSITAASVTLDAIWLERANTAYDVNVYIDDVQVVY